jgi:hypothetical protein
MQRRIFHWLLSTLLLVTSGLVSAQDWSIPRTPEGTPDMQGIWTNASQTPLVRPAEFGEKGFLTADEATEQMQKWRDQYNQLGQDIDPERGPPTDGNSDFGYNSFWWDPRDAAVEINGQFRTSIIISPANGQIPYIGGERADNSLRSQWRAREGVEPYDAPELRPLAERCLLTFSSGSGPPMMPTLYNGNYQIVQTEDHVMILVEMVHDARIIPIDQSHRDTNFEKWMGDSVGFWDGDTLVVRTKDFHPQQSFRGSSNQTLITERFDLIGEDKIKYAFTIEDPLTYSQPWTGELAMNRKSTEEAMYEYACHEGNYAFKGIMAGARKTEADAAQK